MCRLLVTISVPDWTSVAIQHTKPGNLKVIKRQFLRLSFSGSYPPDAIRRERYRLLVWGGQTPGPAIGGIQSSTPDTHLSKNNNQGFW